MRVFAASPGLALLAALLLAPLGARAQGAHGFAHGAAAGPRPLHLRLALADSVAVARVAAVEVGRIRVQDAVVLAGELQPAFEVKRAPSSAPPLEAGERALFLLRGARPPYVSVDEPREWVAIADEAESARWAAAVRELRAAAGDPERVRDTYLGWVRSDLAAQRAEALRALVDLRSALPPVPTEAAISCARSALDAALPRGVRESCAALATLRPEGSDLLLGAVATPQSSLDARFSEIALRGGALQQRPALQGAVQRALRSPDAEVRRAGLRATPFLRTPDVRREVERLAAEDPDPKIRESALRALGASRVPAR